MSESPDLGRTPEDQPDEIWIGRVGPIPVFHDDDPRLEDENARWVVARSIAQALETADELLDGLHSAEWRVRHDVVDRLIARAADDERTVPELVVALRSDPNEKVREQVAMAFHAVNDSRVVEALGIALGDPSEEVRAAARFSLDQLGPT